MKTYPCLFLIYSLVIVKHNSDPEKAPSVEIVDGNAVLDWSQPFATATDFQKVTDILKKELQKGMPANITINTVTVNRWQRMEPEK